MCRPDGRWGSMSMEHRNQGCVGLTAGGVLCLWIVGIKEFDGLRLFFHHFLFSNRVGFHLKIVFLQQNVNNHDATMNTTENTPLWLDLKKEYIDDNWERVQAYFKHSANETRKDGFYQVSIQLFREKISDVVNHVACQPLYEEEETKEQIIYQLRQLATYLLMNDPEAGDLEKRTYMAFLAELQRLYPSYSFQALKAAFLRLRHERIASLGFAWNDLDNIGQELFAYHAVTQPTFEGGLCKTAVYSQHGTALLTQNGLFLTHESQKEALKLVNVGSHSLDKGLGITLCTTQAERLKQSYENDLTKIDEFVKEFLAQQDKTKAENKRKTVALKSYSDGDEATVRISKIDQTGKIYVETVDAGREILQGVITYTLASLFFYDTSSLHTFFKEGDVLKATINYNGNRPVFHIEDQLRTFFDEDTQKSEEECNEFKAKLLRKKSNSYQWINEFGIAMYTEAYGDYNVGDYALLAVSRHNTGKYLGKIDATIIGTADEPFDEKEVRRDCMRAFVDFCSPVVKAKTEEVFGKIVPQELMLLVRMFFTHQKSLTKPADRFHFLAYAAVLAKMLDDSTSLSYIIFEKSYLRALVLFARNEDIKDISLTPGPEYVDATPTRVKEEVVGLLKEYGRNDHSEKLSASIEKFKDTIPMLSRLALLIQTSNSLQGILTDAALNVIRREIIKTLSIETENQADLEVEGKAYLGTESDTLEFKTSIIFPSNNQMQPEERTQNFNIMKGVCAFLNSTSGGTLFLGVNDQGYVCGIENDMRHLKYTHIDMYLRYIQDKACLFFGKDVLPYLHIEPHQDNDSQYVAIRIDPHPYRVVEIDGKAYLRINAESREMSEQMRQELIAKKVFEEKDRAAAISLLQHACANNKCVVLHNYASSNSGSVTDRMVEAYDIHPEDGLAIGYDRKKQEIRVFNINRIGYVEIKENEPWEYQAQHQRMGVDVFHMSGTKPIHVSLEMDLLAKNLLIEEFPRAEEYVSPCKGDTNSWFFDADVYDMKGVGRFYIGLAQHIKIQKAPELKAFVKEYLKELEDRGEG